MIEYLLRKPTTEASLANNCRTILTNIISSHASLNTDIRNIVRTNNGKKTKKYFFFGEESEVKFFEPQLVVTDTGAQERDDNKQFKYIITPPAILRFIEHNRKYFKEPKGGGDLEFDDSEKSEPFLLEAGIKDQMEDNVKIVDYVRSRITYVPDCNIDCDALNLEQKVS